MGRLKPILGYTWAVIAVFIVLATFLGNGYFSRKLASATGVTVSPRITGGEVVQVNDHGAYKALVHRPVFDGLTGDRSTGFIQINWEGAGGLPPVVEERVDLGGNGLSTSRCASIRAQAGRKRTSTKGRQSRWSTSTGCRKAGPCVSCLPPGSYRALYPYLPAGPVEGTGASP